MIREAGCPLQWTVAVCTAGGKRDLLPALASVGAQVSRLPRELLVVDNAPGRGSGLSEHDVATVDGLRARLLRETTLGLSVSRNRAIHHARGAWIAFLDDDAEALPGWLEAYEEAFSDPTVLSAGGPVEPVFGGPLPDWLTDDYLPYLTVWNLGPEPLDLRYNELPRGANVAYRREAFERVGEFDTHLGRRGRSLRSCEEIELGLRLERSGGRTVYVPGARVRHRVDVSRLTPEWMRSRFAAQGFSEAIIDWKHGGFARLRKGFSERRRALGWVEGSEAGDSLRAHCERAASRSYRRGALYALVAVSRWNPPRAG